MNQEEVLAVLPCNAKEAKSIKEIAYAMKLETSSYARWIKAERALSKILRTLIKWGVVACDRRRMEVGHRFWYNTYWRIESRTQKNIIVLDVIT